MVGIWALSLGMAAVIPRRGFRDILREFRWKRRLLLIFGNEMNDAVADQADRLDARQSEAEVRDLAVLTIVGGIVSDHGLDSLPPAVSLRNRFQVGEGEPFAAILVGKDGEEKLRREKPISADELFRLIDALPAAEAKGGKL
jgi:hypothetical protein